VARRSAALLQLPIASAPARVKVSPSMFALCRRRHQEAGRELAFRALIEPEQESNQRLQLTS
jgi:hypothetical protein